MTDQELELLFAEALANPDDAAEALLAIEAEASLIAFVQMMWHILEPKREFVDGWVIREIARHLEAVTNGDIRHLLINVPPGFMKSMLLQVFWPAWEWGPQNRPDMRYIGASYSEALTVRDNRRCRQLIQSDIYQRYWGHRFHLVADQNAKVRFDTSETGFKIATSVGGMGTGERGDRFIIDDPHNVKEGESEAKRNEVLQWQTEVVPTRINDPDKSAILVIMQRVHELDVSGLIIDKGLGYDHLCIPMEYEHDHPNKSHTQIGFIDPRTEDGELAWPERFSKRHLEEDLKPTLRAWGGSYAEAGQLQQRPAPRGGGMFKKEHWGFVDAPPSRVTCRARGWDLASTKNAGAYTAGVKASLAPPPGHSDGVAIYIEDVVRGQWGVHDVETEMVAAANRDGTQCGIDIPQDPGQSGKWQRTYLVSKFQGYDVRSSPETGSKEDRAKPLEAQQESGNVYLVRGPWNDAFINEGAMFPMGQFKDQIDAASRVYARLFMKRPRSAGGAPVLITGG
jgi:predicted phage terminase large subunit-like protein